MELVSGSSSRPEGSVAAVGVALVGCGYVADFYLATMGNHPLRVEGAYDRNRRRLDQFCRFHDVTPYRSLADLLADPAVRIVVNLTNPAHHFEVSLAALLAGRHVYTEKPLATDLTDAIHLVATAEERNLLLASAPCSLLGEAGQTLWHALRSGVIGRPRLVYAEMDDGALHHMPYRRWTSPSGAPWPYRDEFRVGPVLEHAAYHLTWLTAFFGPVAEVVSFTDLLVPDKVPGLPELDPAPDFATACLRFRSGPPVRFTCGTVAPENHGLTIVGDDGVLSIAECWNYGTPVTVRTRTGPDRGDTRTHQYLSPPEVYPPVRPADYHHRYHDTHDMDFARGVADLAVAALKGSRPHLTARHALHVLEVIVAIGDQETARTTISSDFEPPDPMPWAR